MSYGIVKGLKPDHRPRTTWVGARTYGSDFIITRHQVKKCLDGGRCEIYVSISCQNKRIVIRSCEMDVI